MKLAEVLGPDSVVAELAGANKNAVLQELADHLAAQNKEITRDQIVAVLAERERLGSTAIGDGIAIPHGKLSGLRNIVGVFGRHRTGVDFDSLDGHPTFLFFVLVAPEESASLHLKALARVSRMFRNPMFRTRLIDAADAAEIYQLILSEDHE